MFGIDIGKLKKFWSGDFGKMSVRVGVCKLKESYSFGYFLEMFVKIGSLILSGGFLRTDFTDLDKDFVVCKIIVFCPFPPLGQLIVCVESKVDGL